MAALATAPKADDAPADYGTTSPLEHSIPRWDDSYRGNYLSFLWRNLTIAEISGSLGDMGTLLPILVSMAKAGQINLAASLIFGGIFNILSGAVFGIPVCVQPMKSIAAYALAGNLTQGQVMAAGFIVAAVVFVLSATKTMLLFYRSIPMPIVRGIQLGTGVTFVLKGIATISQSYGWGFMNWQWMDNFVICMITFGLCVAMYHARVNTSAIIIFTFGLLVAFLRVWQFSPGKYTVPAPFSTWPTASVPSATDFRIGFVNAALGQLPLSILNSVIAVTKLADDLYPEKAQPVAPITRVGLFLGCMNMISMWFGCIPYCNGSGGLAGQYRYGARTEVSLYVLGAAKLILGILFGSSLVGIFTAFPNSVLGVMLVFSGIELASMAKDAGGLTREGQDSFVVVLIGGLSAAGFANDGIGFLCSVACFVLLAIQRAKESIGSWSGLFASWRTFAYGEFFHNAYMLWRNSWSTEKVATGEKKHMVAEETTM
ncbi:hypothetical protein SmJEL517_g06013 [Synchytrium microbalum]|uniref:SLC26A/SulP transporter domain-containing protein n=1 Tax=Synchytrium microbalum TaxID=1806994 RepID=A0A507BXA2_9FUNG|nr:uncharacterized protein SmJEL517_g06013 [Synchytrium microbalum]TPX30414.1 hypothetical protein SmJEL517_g06013 [Synchytrium microbalum]